MRPTPRLAVGALALGAALALSACSSSDPMSESSSGSSSDAESVIIGSADFSESQLLATIYSQALQDKGVAVEEKLNIGSREVYMQALQDGSIDLLPEYTGYLLAYLDPDTTITESSAVMGALADALPEGITALDMSEAEDKDALVVTSELAQEHGLSTISDLEPIASTLVLGGPPEWKDRHEGVPGLKEVYGLEFKDFQILDAGGPLTLAALQGGQIQVGDLFSSDPSIAENDFVTLEDDKSLFPSANVVPIIRESKVSDTVTSTLNAVSAALTTDDLLTMNGRVNSGDDIETIARDWLTEKGL
ncbi:ABC transporter substrate-binding protein [Actinomyces polynesiensis]|uniref:ABC transporter substrate-binding protein n=1 Tax=Actinomyces polynesiensis TaxID=1325934 RepID=UPI0005BAF1EF|nr:ABC transporter substrate-binding protein [Actinomyces polynesiensis]